MKRKVRFVRGPSKGGQNFMCDKCKDKGYVYSWVFFQVTCPKCKGDPVSVMPPRPPDPKGSGGSNG